LSFILRTLYLMRRNPIALIVIIMSQAILVCICAWSSIKIRWFSYILFLIFLGGLIVLFIYITRLASNEKINLSMRTGITVTGILVTALIITMASWNNQIINLENIRVIKYFNTIYSNSARLLIFITITYLLLTLVIVVKISNKFNSPIKNIIF